MSARAEPVRTRRRLRVVANRYTGASRTAVIIAGGNARPPGGHQGIGAGRVYAFRPMSHTDELDEYDAELELRLKREYADVFPLFRYCVLTQEATYLCNRLERQVDPQAAYPFFHVVMEDVWVWDKNRPTRIIPRVEIHTTQDITVEVLRTDDKEPLA